MNDEFIGRYVIIRGDNSGVFFGILTERKGTEVKLSNCRRLWQWSGAASLSQLATEGVKRPKDCRFTVTVDSIIILDAIEVIPCTDYAVENIIGVDIWRISD